MLVEMTSRDWSFVACQKEQRYTQVKKLRMTSSARGLTRGERMLVLEARKGRWGDGVSGEVGELLHLPFK